MRPVPCLLVFHTLTREITMGRFASKAAARRYVDEVGWERPYSTRRG